jgi:uncharacterized protein YggE
MQQIPVLAVRGEAALDVEPEIARIEVSVAATDTDRARTLQLLAERAAAVEKVLESFPDVIERSESSGARISPQQAGRPLRDREERGYLGAMHHAITVTGFDRLGELMAQLAERELTEVGGPWWELRAQSPVYRDARVAAARDAVRRARDYAGALGSQLTGLVELADARLLSDARVPAEPAAGFPARLPQRTRAVVPEELTIDLAPARQTVRAAVEARFTISKPDLAGVDTG